MNIQEILGTKYEIEEVDDDTLKKLGVDGRCSIYEKRIEIRPPDQMLEDNAEWSARYKRFKEVLRHEIIHAFLHESGMDKYDEDEDLVAWIAVQFPKIARVFKELQCEEET